jgi:hypothetical protein
MSYYYYLLLAGAAVAGAAGTGVAGVACSVTGAALFSICDASCLPLLANTNQRITITITTIIQNSGFFNIKFLPMRFVGWLSFGSQPEHFVAMKGLFLLLCLSCQQIQTKESIKSQRLQRLSRSPS